MCFEQKEAISTQSSRQIHILLYSHMRYIYTHTCRIHTDAMNKTSEDFFKNIYPSLYCKVCVWEGVGDWTKTAIYWPTLLWPSALCLSRSPGLLNRRLRGSASLGHSRVSFSFSWCSAGGPGAHSTDFLYCILSQTGLVSKLHRGSRGPLLLGGGFPYHILSPTLLTSNSLTSCSHRVI